MRASLLVAALLLPALGLSACKSACRSLSEKLCDCETNSTLRQACLQRVSEQEGQVAVTPEQEEYCEGKLKTCSCENLGTPEGREACGLAR